MPLEPVALNGFLYAKILPLYRHAVRLIFSFAGRRSSPGLASRPVHLAAEAPSHLTHATLAAKLCTPPLFRENLRVETGMRSLHGFFEVEILPVQGPEGPLEGRHDVVEGGEVKGILEGIPILHR